jgi:mannosylfructose-phosphate synthase
MISTHGYVGSDPPLGAPDTGGQVVYVLELAKKLSEFKYTVDIWTRRFEDQPEIDRVNPRVRVIRMPCGGKAFVPKEYLCRHLGEWVQNAFEYIQRHRLKYDFINSHYWDAGIVGQHLARTLSVPHLHTPHSLGTWKRVRMEKDFPEDADRFEEKYNFAERIRNEQKIYDECNLITATTPVQLDRLTSDYSLPAGKIRFIPPGYDDSRFFRIGSASRDLIREQLGFNGSVVLAISRLARNKGFDLLIEGFSVVARRRPEAQLVLAVGHEDRDENEEQLYQELLALRKKHGLQDRIRFIGYVADKELADYYRAADVFVLSSRYEPFGMTAIEAMACGTPVVATIHGGLFRILNYGEHVLFADPFDCDELGITILKALRYRTLRRRLSESGAQMARSLFTWTSVTQQLLNAADSQVTSELVVHVRPGDDH